jgi:hypothetical protein
VDEYFEMIADEVEVRDPKFAWKIVGVYRAPNEDVRVIERLAARRFIKKFYKASL